MVFCVRSRVGSATYRWKMEWAQKSQESAPSDVKLLMAIEAGEQYALSCLYEQHAPHMLSLALALLGDIGIAEDLVHDVFLEVWRNAHRYCPRRGSVRAWMRLRLRSRARDRYRALQAAARYELAAGSIAMGAAVAADDPSRLCEQTLAVAALRELPTPLRVVAQLVYVEGYTCTEVSQLCAIPRGTVKSRLAATRRALLQTMTRVKEQP